MTSNIRWMKRYSLEKREQISILRRSRQAKRKLVMGRIKYPPIPSLCLCSCKEITWNGHEHIHGHNTRIEHPMKDYKYTNEEIIKSSIAHTKTFLLRPDGSKEIYPCIPILCYCSCNEVVWKRGKKYISEHFLKVVHPTQGKPLSEEHGKKIAESNRRRKVKESTRSKQSESARKSINSGRFTSERMKDSGNPMFGIPPTPGVKYTYISPFQSEVKLNHSYEYRYAIYLDFNNIKWYYQWFTFLFVFNGKQTSYTPDFFLPEFNKFIEIKGRIYENTKERFNCFRKQYPNINIEMLFEKDLIELGIDMRRKKKLKKGKTCQKE